MAKPFLPKRVRHLCVPPIKCQGIKTKLVRFIASNIQWAGTGRWAEPFLGSGVVLFNVCPDRAIAADINAHVIGFYKSLQDNTLDAHAVREYLEFGHAQLVRGGEAFYYEVRDRFNSSHSPLDFLFLSRACFNGLMRFNSKGGFNVPFCRKTHRFGKAYVSKIVNQVERVQRLIRDHDWEFRVADWRETLVGLREDDFVYLDPPYIGRHTDYYGRWGDEDATSLVRAAAVLPCGFALSMWSKNRYRVNSHLDEWTNCVKRTFSHFYHVGSLESLRNEMEEALLIGAGYEAESAVSAGDERVEARVPAQLHLL